MPNRYSKAPRRSAGTFLVRLTADELARANWLSRRLQAQLRPHTMSDVLRLSLAPEVVTYLLNGKL